MITCIMDECLYNGLRDNCTRTLAAVTLRPNSVKCKGTVWSIKKGRPRNPDIDYRISRIQEAR